MFWENNQRRSSNLFFWGAISGIVGGYYLSRWMKNEHHQDFSNPGKHSSDSANVGTTVNKDKDQLFETFIHGSDQELKEKASDMNLKN